MIIDLIKLKSGMVNQIDIDEVLTVDSELLKENGILELKDVKVNGFITKDSMEEYDINLKIYGTMVLPCSISLKPTNHPFDIEINGNINELLEEISKNEENSENLLDIFPIIWENILMEIPMRIVNDDIEDVKLQGDGWRVITGEYESVNPELEKLKDLLK